MNFLDESLETRPIMCESRSTQTIITLKKKVPNDGISNENSHQQSRETSTKSRNLRHHVSFRISPPTGTSSSNVTLASTNVAKKKRLRRNSKQNFNACSQTLDREPYVILQVLDGQKKASSGSGTEILKARENRNQYQRIKNDKSINSMLITVSVAFLVLTFPYQLIWLTDQIYKIYRNYKKDVSSYSNANNSNNISPKFRGNESDLIIRNIVSDMEEKIDYGINIYELVSYTIMDIALIIRNLNFSMNFFLYSTMSNLFRKELNMVFQNLGFYHFSIFKNSISTSNDMTNANLNTANNRVSKNFNTRPSFFLTETTKKSQNNPSPRLPNNHECDETKIFCGSTFV